MTGEERLNDYLKERNIPVNSLEANSIRECVNWVIETIKLSDCNPKARPCVLTSHGIDTDVIKWADENPKEGLVSIDKVCKWLENDCDIKEYLGGIFSDPCSVNFDWEKLSDNLRKAMEE